ncbi:acetyl-CoA carboxylase biotin carboxyl carrier protein subunit [Neolewinella aurantiaca]|uniref:Acetyl-CoA carboxylase biotin carboxyl carrier protein subunit n=1 Tax=Neolewinella aurantiaca TaxID=2602767 RepID=A0A5C7FA01_9BACT|nr:biotin/lipoyl-containing protein [Neolewinella aurantiaca]TXF87601.1 acetyl-CoA carboxylase biotin carboxyl carrier protein subunit [Neolewinella aurantiaca]
MPKYQVTINGQEYPVKADDLANLDVLSPAPGKYHLIRDGKSYHIEVLALNMASKMVTLTVNGRQQSMKIADETDQLVKELGFAAVATTKSKNIIAPMPGLVLDVMVKPGDQITEGTPLLILEAMKMENVLKAEGDGEVKTISVEKGQAVEKKQLLIEIE